MRPEGSLEVDLSVNHGKVFEPDNFSPQATMLRDLDLVFHYTDALTGLHNIAMSESEGLRFSPRSGADDPHE